MTKAETITIINALINAYPNSFKDGKAIQAMVDPWYSVLKTKRGDFVAVAVSELIQQTAKTPTLSEVVERYGKIYYRETGREDYKYDDPELNEAFERTLRKWGKI